MRFTVVVKRNDGLKAPSTNGKTGEGAFLIVHNGNKRKLSRLGGHG